MEATKTEAKKGEVETLELTRQQQLVARRVSESRATVPHLHMRVEAVLSDAGDPSGLEILAIRSAAAALRNHPRVNGSYRNGTAELYSRINLGFAVAARESTFFPVINDADGRSADEIAGEAARLADRARSGEITPPELSGATFSVISLPGTRGFDPAVNPGQAAILAIGGITERPVVRDGQVMAGQVVELGLSVDNRILSGHEGAAFLEEVKSSVESGGAS